MKKVKLGFLGSGFMGQLAHLQNYAVLDTCEVAGITDVKRQQAEKVARAYFIPRVYADADELLADREIDAVVAAQPFDNHVNIACRVLNAGKHLMTEKPLCVYWQNGKALVECAAKNNKIHMVGNHKRSDPAVEYAVGVIKKWKTTGEMGAMTYVRIVMPPGDWVGGATGANKPIMTDEAYAAYEKELAPDGVDAETAAKHIAFVNYYIHQVNLMRFLLGEEFKLTFADRRGVLLAVESASNVTGTIEMAAYATTDAWHESATVCFEKGYIDVRLPAPLASQRAGEVTVFTDNGAGGEPYSCAGAESRPYAGGMFCSPVLPNVSAMRNQAANFIKAVNGEADPPCSSAEALKDLVFAEAYINYMEKYK